MKPGAKNIVVLASDNVNNRPNTNMLQEMLGDSKRPLYTSGVFDRIQGSKPIYMNKATAVINQRNAMTNFQAGTRMGHNPEALKLFGPKKQTHSNVLD